MWLWVRRLGFGAWVLWLWFRAWVQVWGLLLGLWVEVCHFWLRDVVLTRFSIRGSKTWSRYGGWVLGEDPGQKTRCGVLDLCLGFDAQSKPKSKV